MNIKSLITGLVIGVFVTTSTITLASSDINLIINDQKIETEVPPRIEDGRTLVPIRIISEELGYNVDWDGENNRVLIESKDGENEITESKQEQDNKTDEEKDENDEYNEILKIGEVYEHKDNKLRLEQFKTKEINSQLEISYRIVLGYPEFNRPKNTMNYTYLNSEKEVIKKESVEYPAVGSAALLDDQTIKIDKDKDIQYIKINNSEYKIESIWKLPI